MTGRGKEIDLRSLLGEALAEEPSSDLSDGIMKRLAAVKTVVELGRLVGVAPSNWAVDRSDWDHPDDHDDADEDGRTGEDDD